MIKLLAGFHNPLSELFDDLGKAPNAFREVTGELFKGPLYIIALVVVLGLILGFAYMRKTKITTRALTQTALCVALSIILNLLVVYKMPQGGSVTVGAMIPLFLIALAHGPALGILAGFLFGLIDMLLGGYIVHPLQMLLDYPLAFMCMGLIGFLAQRYALGAVIALSGQLLFSTLSGVIFFSEYAGAMNPWLYSFTYNGTFILANGVISLILLKVLPIKRLVRIMNNAGGELKYW